MHTDPAIRPPITLADHRAARAGAYAQAQAQAAHNAAMAQTDAYLVGRAQMGDLQAWARLYQDAFDAVFRHVCYLTGDAVASEDLVQEAFARAMTCIASFDGRSSFVTWMRGIALNVVRMHWRRAKTKQRVHGDLQDMQQVAPALGFDPDRVHVQDQRMRAVYEILATLPDNLREAFVLRELEGLPPEEAAAQLGISANNLAVRASRARSRIRKELVRRGWLGQEAAR